jgi:hypothetical protein
MVTGHRDAPHPDTGYHRQHIHGIEDWRASRGREGRGPARTSRPTITFARSSSTSNPTRATTRRRSSLRHSRARTEAQPSSCAIEHDRPSRGRRRRDAHGCKRCESGRHGDADRRIPRTRSRRSTLPRVATSTRRSALARRLRAGTGADPATRITLAFEQRQARSSRHGRLPLCSRDESFVGANLARPKRGREGAAPARSARRPSPPRSEKRNSVSGGESALEAAPCGRGGAISARPGQPVG